MLCSFLIPNSCFVLFGFFILCLFVFFVGLFFLEYHISRRSVIRAIVHSKQSNSLFRQTLTALFQYIPSVSYSQNEKKYSSFKKMIVHDVSTIAITYILYHIPPICSNKIKIDSYHKNHFNTVHVVKGLLAKIFCCNGCLYPFNDPGVSDIHP